MSFRRDSCSIGGNKAKAIPQTEVDPSNVHAQQLCCKLLWVFTLTDGDVFPAAKSGNPLLQERPFKHV